MSALQVGSAFFTTFTAQPLYFLVLVPLVLALASRSLAAVGASTLMLIGSLAVIASERSDVSVLLGPAIMTLVAAGFVLIGFEQRRSLNRIRAFEGRLQEAELQHRRNRERELLKAARAHEPHPRRPTTADAREPAPEETRDEG